MDETKKVNILLAFHFLKIEDMVSLILYIGTYSLTFYKPGFITFDQIDVMIHLHLWI